MSAERSTPPDAPEPTAPARPVPFQTPPDAPRETERFLGGLGGGFVRLPWRRLALAGVVAALLMGAAGFLSSSLREVPSGHAGIAVHRFRGTSRLLSPGSHFLPRLFYGLALVRVTDQMVPAQFNVTSKDGFKVVLSVQARFAVDRDQVLARWASLPPDPGREIVAPVLASTFRAGAPAFDAAELRTARREALADSVAKLAGGRLRESGLVLRDLYVSDLQLPAEFEQHRLALQEEIDNVERMEATLRLKEKEGLKLKMEAEAEKMKVEKQAEALASQRLIAARAESDAMKYVIPLKEQEIKQRELEAEAEKARKVKDAQTEAEAAKIRTAGEADRRRVLAEAEAFAIRTTSQAQFEGLRREAELIQANPVWVSKIFAERISDKVQVILTPQLSSNVYTDEVLKRVAAGKPAVAARRGEPEATVAETRSEAEPSKSQDGEPETENEESPR